MESEHQPDDDFDVDIDDPVTRKDIRLSGNATFEQLARDFNTSIQEQEYVLTEDYDKITKRAQNDLKNLLKERCMLTARSIAPTHYEELFNDMVRAEYSRIENSDLTKDDIWIVQLKKILPTMNKNEKIVLLSAFAFTDTKKSLAQTLDVSERIVRVSRRHAKDVAEGVRHQRTKVVRHKMKPAQVEHYMDFLFDTQLQTMSWGKMTMKFDDGHSENLPAVVRKNIPTHIVELYNSYCKSECPDFQPLSLSTLLRILDKCPAKTRKSMAGLDDYMEEGLSGLKTFNEVADKLKSKGASTRMLTDTVSQCKIYMKGELKLHISSDKSCASHCRTYALSDPDAPEFFEKCEHRHSNSCASCSKIEFLFQHVGKEINKWLTSAEKEETEYDVSIAKQ